MKLVSWKKVRNVYLLLSLLILLPMSFIFGINTLFLLDGGLINTQAFAVNAFYTVGLLLFEIPTGVIADTWGRRTSYLIGALVQFISTLLYFYMWYINGPFWGWALSSVLLGLGYTFFSGALEAWLVDSLKAVDYKGRLDDIFAKAQILNGVAMFVGTIGGGLIAQFTNLGVPYLLRAMLQIGSFFIAIIVMKEINFTANKTDKVVLQFRKLLSTSWNHGLKNVRVRWIMLSAPFMSGVGIYAFYASQPYLLELFGDKEAVGIAGIAAAIISLTQILGGFSVNLVHRLFALRTNVLIFAGVINAISLVLVGYFMNFWLAIGLLLLWAIAYAASMPVRQAYLNSLIRSSERATVLSFDSMVSSGGGVVFQPILGRVSDIYGYATSYIVSGIISIFSLPFLLLAKRQKLPSDDTNN